MDTSSLSPVLLVLTGTLTLKCAIGSTGSSVWGGFGTATAIWKKVETVSVEGNIIRVDNTEQLKNWKKLAAHAKLDLSLRILEIALSTTIAFGVNSKCSNVLLVYTGTT